MRNKSKKNNNNKRIKKYFMPLKNKSKKGKIGGGDNKQPVLYDDIGIEIQDDFGKNLKSFNPIPIVQFNFKPNQMDQLHEPKKCTPSLCHPFSPISRVDYLKLEGEPSPPVPPILNPPADWCDQKSTLKPGSPFYPFNGKYKYDSDKDVENKSQQKIIEEGYPKDSDVNDNKYRGFYAFPINKKCKFRNIMTNLNVFENSDKNPYLKFMLSNEDKLRHDSPDNYQITKNRDNTYNLGFDKPVTEKEFINIPEDKYKKINNYFYNKLNLKDS